MRMILAAVALSLALGAATAIAEPRFWQAEFPRTDFTQTSLADWTEIRDGGPGRDGIPALSDPAFLPVAAETTLAATDPVVVLELAGTTPRAYPLRYLTWHEIVNDMVGDTPVAVTFCPLCNSAPVFDRRVGGAVLSFGVSGKLRNSDMIMYDRETESWWQQAIGEGVVGVHTGARLTQLVSWTEGWASFAARNPEGLVMAAPDHRRPYGTNPYEGYDSRAAPYPFYTGEAPPHGVPALARVVRVGAAAWPLARLAEAGEIAEAGVTLSWAPGQASALDTGEIARGRDVGSIRVRDAAGADIAHDVMFAFAFHAFFPEGTWHLGE